MITFGSTPAVTYLPDLRSLEIKISKEPPDQPLLTLLQEQLSHVTLANVCLSGGVDSQFILRLAKTLGVPVTAYTYLSTWGGSPINTDDLVYAQRSALAAGVQLHTVEIDLKEFFESNLHIHYGKRFITPSPQIAVHLHFLYLLKDIPGTFLMGGELPLFCKGSPIQEGPCDVAGINPSFMVRCVFAYRRAAQEFDIDLVRDIFLYSPDIIHSSLNESINIVRNHQMHLEVPDEPNLKTYPNRVKHVLFNELIPGGIDPLLKATGFEKLKKYMAAESGIYNKFDLEYRRPMVDLYERHMQNPNSKTEATVRFSSAHTVERLAAEFRDAIVRHNSKCVAQYFLDF
jgi:hypothetical protein